MSGVVVVPAAPLMVASAAPAVPGEVAEVRAAAAAALATIDHADVTVLLAAGPPGSCGVHATAIASLAPLGAPSRPMPLPVATSLATAIAELARDLLGGATAPLQAPLDLAASSLALQIEQAGLDTLLVAVTLDPAGQGEDLIAFGRALADLLRTCGPACAVVAAGDTSACLTDRSPGYLVAGADDFDAAVVATLDACDDAALARLGPERATEMIATAWAPLVAATALMAACGLTTGPVLHASPRGVGYVITTASASAG